jgi:hypothetical protein
MRCILPLKSQGTQPIRRPLLPWGQALQYTRKQKWLLAPCTHHLAPPILRNVMSLVAAEAECGAPFHNTKDDIALCTTLNKMGHPQPATPVQADNPTTNGFANKQLKQLKQLKQQCRSKSMGMMHFYWVQARSSRLETIPWLLATRIACLLIIVAQARPIYTVRN